MECPLERHRPAFAQILEARQLSNKVKHLNNAKRGGVTILQDKVIEIEIVYGRTLQIHEVNLGALTNHYGHGQSRKELAGLSEPIHVMNAIVY